MSLPDSHQPPDFIAAKAVLEGWQRAYERADEATLGVAVSALARLACNTAEGFNSERWRSIAK